MLPGTSSYNKPAIRANYLRRRSMLGIEQREQYTMRAVQHLASYMRAIAPKIIGLYMPIQDELSPLNMASTHKGNYCLPVALKDGSMTFHRWQPDDPLQHGAFNIMHPLRPDPVTPDCIITPLASYDSRGARIGYGKGFYDRYFHMHTGIIKHRIGLAFSCQHYPQDLPNDAHDVMLDAVINEQGIMSITHE